MYWYNKRKRDWDLIRKILLKLEEKADNTSFLENDVFDGVSPAIVNYHYKLLEQAGLITLEDLSDLDGENYVALSLTWQGHEFFDKIRSDNVWNKIKNAAKAKSLDLSFDVIKSICATLITSILSGD